LSIDYNRGVIPAQVFRLDGWFKILANAKNTDPVLRAAPAVRQYADKAGKPPDLQRSGN
jgi:hypothetical protein